MSQTVLLHNTLQITAVFKNFAGVVTDPDGAVVTLKWYNGDWEILTTESLPVAYKTATGTWRYFFVPTEEGDFHHVWSGLMSGRPFERSFEVNVVREL